MKGKKARDRDTPSRTKVRPADFEGIFRRYYGVLVGFFINRGLSRADSEDLAQDTLVRAYCSYDTFRRDASDSTWLFSIAWNLWRNHIRHNRAQKRHGDNVSLDVSEDLSREIELFMASRDDYSEKNSALRLVLEDEKSHLARQGIQELPAQMRRGLILYASGKLEHKDIAQILGIEVNTVKSLVSQAKVKLREAMRRKHPEFFDSEGEKK